MSLLEIVKDRLRDWFQSPSSGDFLLGVSGGVDSIVLADVMERCSRTMGFRPTMAHYNYRRHDRADEAERLVRSWCDNRGVPYVGGCLRRPGDVHRERRGLEGALRDLRYRWFQQLVSSGEYDGLFLAHHRADQAETVMLNMGRGSGLSGLAGMGDRDSVKGLSIYRPLLDCEQEELRDYHASRDLPVVEDPTNRSLEHTRNQLRHEVIPAWEEAQSGVTSSLAHLSRVAERENNFWDQHVREAVDVTCWEREIHVDRDSFLDAHRAVQDRLCHWIPRWLTGSAHGWTRRNLSTLRELFHADSGRRLDLPGPLRAIVEYGRVAVYDRRSLHEHDFPFTPSGLHWSHSTPMGQVTSGPVENQKEPTYRTPVREGGFPVDRVRTWRAGDRLRGPGKNRRLKELFQEHRIPRRARHHWPVFVRGAQVVGVPGLGISDDMDHNESSWSLAFEPAHPAFVIPGRSEEETL
jgi:tRNA(Ile)-lysidine synthase